MGTGVVIWVSARIRFEIESLNIAPIFKIDVIKLSSLGRFSKVEEGYLQISVGFWFMAL